MALAEEQAFFEAEGLPWAPVALDSERSVLAALFGPGINLFRALDDEQLVGAGADAPASLEAVLRTAVAPRADGALVLGDTPGVFTVKHYAGEVTYAVAPLVDANVDTMDATLRAFLAKVDPSAPPLRRRRRRRRPAAPPRTRPPRRPPPSPRPRWAPRCAPAWRRSPASCVPPTSCGCGAFEARATQTTPQPRHNQHIL